MSEPEVRAVIPGEGPSVRRRIVVWRRLEPGDVRSPGAVFAPESPFLEARCVEITLPLSFHASMVRLAEARARARALPKTAWIEYEPAGVLIAGAGGAAFGAWLDYLRPASLFLNGAAVVGSLGVVLAVVAKRRRARAEADAAQRWATSKEKPEHDEIARTLAEGWFRVVQDLKRDTGFHTEVRVAEGSTDPLRLASIDPRPLLGGGSFDPEDWLPTEGGGVRYEAMHASGELVTRLLPGSEEVAALPESNGETPGLAGLLTGPPAS